jgi:hypothetical protein
MVCEDCDVAAGGQVPAYPPIPLQFDEAPMNHDDGRKRSAITGVQ